MNADLIRQVPSLWEKQVAQEEVIELLQKIEADSTNLLLYVQLAASLSTLPDHLGQDVIEHYVKTLTDAPRAFEAVAHMLWRAEKGKSRTELAISWMWDKDLPPDVAEAREHFINAQKQLELGIETLHAIAMQKPAHVRYDVLRRRRGEPGNNWSRFTEDHPHYQQARDLADALNKRHDEYIYDCFTTGKAAQLMDETEAEDAEE